MADHPGDRVDARAEPLGIVADREQMPDAWPLADNLRDELETLLALAAEEA